MPLNSASRPKIVRKRAKKITSPADMTRSRGTGGDPRYVLVGFTTFVFFPAQGIDNRVRPMFKHCTQDAQHCLHKFQRHPSHDAHWLQEGSKFWSTMWRSWRCWWCLTRTLGLLSRHHINGNATQRWKKKNLFLRTAFVHQIFSVKVREFQHICERTKSL